ncbi:uncharacterized protein V1518DRAFT_429373 [Limtongia smithiae]|uniref:uncharacterized protein n=1 Tax=Limtongia smithiae TaxID=1125753 RepID=UPI0034CF15E0
MSAQAYYKESGPGENQGGEQQQQQQQQDRGFGGPPGGGGYYMPQQPQQAYGGPQQYGGGGGGGYYGQPGPQYSGGGQGYGGGPQGRPSNQRQGRSPSPTPSPSPPSSRPQSSDIFLTFTFEDSAALLPAMASSNGNKRTLAEAAQDNRQGGSPRIRVLEDTSVASDTMDGVVLEESFTRSVPLRLGDMDLTVEVDRSPQDSSSSGPTPTESSHTSVSPIVSRGEQIEKIKILCNMQMEEGQSWYLLPSEWWAEFVNPNVTELKGIDNSTIVDTYGRLKPDARVEIVPETAWKLLCQWYDEDSEFLEVPRIAVNTSLNPNVPNIEVELNPPAYNIYNLSVNTSDSAFRGSLTMSRTNRYSELESAVKDKLDIKQSDEIRIWRLDTAPQAKVDAHSFGLISDKTVITATEDETLQSLGLGMGCPLVVEQKSLLSDEWVSERKPALSHLSSHKTEIGPTRRPLPPRQTGRRHVNERHVTKGTTGLQNMGNTCYMNSALQCMMHIEELTRYFLVDAYKEELNPQNPLAMDGKMATAYAQLVRSIFAVPNAPSSLAPRDLQNVIWRYGPMFSGYAQHDSQELLAFLLDGLHEDLNRILKKPYTEKPELRDDQVGSKEAVVELANKCWSLHLMRNDSIIQDLFTGMYKSTLVCPECGKVSITFDPFTDLTLPLPINNHILKQVIFMPAQGRPVRIDVEVTRSTTVKEFKSYLASVMHSDGTRLISVSLYNHKFFSVHSDNDAIFPKLADNDEAVVYELDRVPQESDASDLFVIPVVNTIVQDQSARYLSSNLFGYPFLITLTPAEAASYGTIYAKLVEKYKGFTTQATIASWGIDENDSDASEDMDVGSPTRPEIFSINVSSRSTRQSYFQSSWQTPLVNTDLSNTEEIRDRFNKRHTKGPTSMIIDPASEQDEDLEESNMQPLRMISANNSSTSFVAESDMENISGLQWTPNIMLADVDMPDAIEKDDDSTSSRRSSVATRRGGSEASDSDDEIMNMRDLFEKPTQAHKELKPSELISFNRTYDSPLYVSAGETIVCEWTQNVHDQCFNGLKSMIASGDATWDIMETIVPDDVQERRTHRRSRKHDDIDLEDCLNLFAKPEVLGEDDLWYCPRCKKHQRAIKTIEIWKVPDICAVHLKRFSAISRRDKITVKIDFPVEGLDLTDRVGDPEQVENPERLIYDLFAVDNHLGGLGGGHYTANVKNFMDGKWYYFDDSSVHEVSPEDGVTAAAYMLFYRRRSSQKLGGAKMREVISREDVFQLPEDESVASHPTEPTATAPTSIVSTASAIGASSAAASGNVLTSSTAAEGGATKTQRFPGKGRTLGSDASVIAGNRASWTPRSDGWSLVSAGKSSSERTTSELYGDKMDDEPVISGTQNLLKPDVQEDDDIEADYDIVREDDANTTTDMSEDVSRIDALAPSDGTSVSDDVIDIKPESFQYGDNDVYQDEIVEDILL